MVQQVDPFVHPIPSEFTKNQETAAFFEYFVRWAHDMWKRTGGGDDFVSNTDTAELFPWQMSDSEPEYNYNFNRSNTVDEVSKFVGFNRGQKEVKPYFIVSSNHTCYGPEIVEATSNITITLNQEPNESEVTTIKRNTTAGNVILDGGSFNIDGSSTYTMVVNYEGINVVFNGTEYLII